MDLLIEGANKIGIELTQDQIDKLEKYIKEIELFNPVYKLVGYQDRSELIIKHILDSLAGVKEIEKINKGVIADLGSGAGFPGIVLAIMLDSPIVLIERMKRRVDFLKNVILRCNLTNVKIIAKDVSEVDEKFDTITCRAFHPIYDIIQDVERLLTTDGVFAAYKGRKSYLLAETENLSAWKLDVIPLQVPFLDEQRHLALMRKKN